jgi:hypothetical protein
MMFPAAFLILPALAVILGAGAGILRLLLREAHSETTPAERWGLSWILGAGYVSVAMFAVGWAIRGPALIALLVAGAAIIFHAATRVGGTARSRGKKFSALEWGLTALLLGQGVFLLWWTPQVALGWDGMVLWEAKARIAAENGGFIPLRYFSEPPFPMAQARYPLFLPNTEAWLYLWMGSANQSWVRILGPLTYLAGTCILAGAAQRLGASRTISLATAVAFFFVPYFFTGQWNVLSGYADFPLGVIFLAAASRLPCLAAPGSNAELRLFAVLAGLATWVKQEGVYLWLILIGIASLILLPRRGWKAALAVAVPGIVIAGGYSIFLRVAETPADPFYHPPTPANLLAFAHRIGPVFHQLGRELMHFEFWSFLWIGALFALLSLAAQREWMIAVPLSLAISLPLLFYVWPFILSALDSYQNHMEHAFPRLMLQIAPTAMLAIGLAAPRDSHQARENGGFR